MNECLFNFLKLVIYQIRIDMITELSEKIEVAYEAKTKVEQDYEEKVKPLLSDLGKMESLYRWFKSNNKLNEDRHVGYRLFALMSTTLYCPSYFAERRLKRIGLREELARLFNIDPRTVSAHISSAHYWYKTYPFFKNEADRLLKEIISNL